MTYASEEVLATIKDARVAKGLSQRDLSARTGVPQSHISKIESGGTDIRLSSLIELARALDLELKLVPRRAVSAVETVIRGVVPPAATRPDTVKAARELERTLDSIEAARTLFPDQAALKRLHDDFQSLKNLRSAGGDITSLLPEARKALEPLQKQLAQIRKASETMNALPAETLRSLTQAADTIHQLRNQIAHGLPAAASPRPAYRLGEDGDDGHG